MPKAGKPLGLYFSGQNFEYDASNDNLVLSAGAVVYAHSYFNSFFLEYWREFTSIQDLGVRVKKTGALLLRLIGIASDGTSEEIASIQLNNDSIDATLWIPADDFSEISQFSRLCVNFESEDGAIVTEAEFVTHTAPSQAITLSIGICTFKNEALLADCLNELQETKANCPEIKDIYVVNQGDVFSDPALVSLQENKSFTFIEQSNLGGCGGFNRTMVEAAFLNENPASHHLMMDDDIILDGRVIQRTIQFLSYADADVVVGGHLLEINEPNLLVEAGSKLIPLWVPDPIGFGLHVTEQSALDQISQINLPDFNGWWYCAIPTRCIQELGLSAPTFIRFDDIEYGIRLKSKDIPIVSFPAIAIWHHSFAFQETEWINYYNLRNQLILSSFHPGLIKKPDFLFILGYIMNFVLSHRYGSAAMVRKAVKDFLDGRDRGLGVDAATKHQEIKRFLSSLKPLEKFPIENVKDIPTREFQHVPTSVLLVLVLFVTNFCRLVLPRFKSGSLINFPDGGAYAYSVGSHDFVKPNSSKRDEYNIFRLNRWSLIKETTLAFVASFRFLLKRNGAMRNWAKAQDQLTSLENWQDIFDESNRSTKD